MANTRQSSKRARLAKARQTRNTTVRTATRTAVRATMEAIKTKDLDKAKTAYVAAVKALAKAASKGAMPKGRAARKISRITLFLKKTNPAALNFKAGSAK